MVCLVACVGLNLPSMALKAGELLDWVVAVVGNNAITASEVKLQLRLEAFLNQRSVDDSDTARHQAAERLIEVNLIAEEMRVTNFLAAKDQEIERELRALYEQDYPNKLAFSEALETYSLDEDVLRTFLRRQINVLRFIDFRFRTGLDVSEETVETYYEDIYKARVRQLEGRAPEPLAEVRVSLREVVLQARVDELLNDWLKLLRTSNRVEYVSSTRRGL